MLTSVAYREEVQSWTFSAQQALLDCLECSNILNADVDDLNRNFRQVLTQICLRSTATSDSVLCLVAAGKVWDAEILIRTVAEATLKFLYIALGDDAEQLDRTNEFIIKLPDISRIRRHKRVKGLLERLPDPSAEEWRPIRDLVMSDQEFEELNRQYEKSDRSRLEGKWGFTQLAETIANFGPQFKPIAGLLFQYGMACHATHLDGDGILLMCDRESRREPGRSAIEVAHAAREVSDVVTFAMLRVFGLFKAGFLERSSVDEVSDRYDPLMDNLRLATERWHCIEYGSSG